MKDCHTEGTIKGSKNLGGIAGLSSGGLSYLECTSKCHISGEDNTGGLIGELMSYSNKPLVISKCTTNCIIITESTAGGLIGLFTGGGHVLITQCFSESMIDCSKFCAGGIIGVMGRFDNVTIKNVY